MAKITIEQVFQTLFATSRLTADNTTNGKTLETLKGSALSGDLKRLILFGDDTGEYIVIGTGNIDGTAPELPIRTPMVLDIDKTLADTIKLFSTSGGDVTMIELG